MEEIWKPVVGYEGIYEVSNDGRVRNCRTGKELRQHKSYKGYFRVYLYKDSLRKSIFTHRVVATAFIPNPENKPCIDHINAIRTDNTAKNLRWATWKENSNNPIYLDSLSKRIISEETRIKHSLSSKGRVMSEEAKLKISKSAKGRKPSENCKTAHRRKINQYTLDGEFIKTWDMIKSASLELGISKGNIAECCRMHRTKAGGFIWRYAD